MQAIIMAAGKGSRLGARTEGNPKSFVEIRGKKLTRDMENVYLRYNPFYEMVNVLGVFLYGDGGTA